MLEFIHSLGSKFVNFISTKLGTDAAKRQRDSLSNEVSATSTAKRMKLDMDEAGAQIGNRRPLFEDRYHSESFITVRQPPKPLIQNGESYRNDFDDKASEALEASRTVGCRTGSLNLGGFSFTSAKRDLREVSSFQFSPKANAEPVTFQGSPWPLSSENGRGNDVKVKAQPVYNKGTGFERSNGFLAPKSGSLVSRFLGGGNVQKGIKSLDARRRNKHATKQCFRLDEKSKYQELLSRHLSHHGATALLPAYSIERHIGPNDRCQSNDSVGGASDDSTDLNPLKDRKSADIDIVRRFAGMKSLLESVVTSEQNLSSASALPAWRQLIAERRRSQNALPDRSLQHLQRVRYQPMKALHSSDVKVPSTEADAAVSSKEPVVPDETPRAAAEHRMTSVSSRNHEDGVKVWRSCSGTPTLISDSPFPAAVLGQRQSTLRDCSTLVKKSTAPELFERALKESPYADREFLEKINSKMQSDFTKQSILEKETTIKYYKEQREKEESLLVSKMRNLLQTTARIPVPLEEIYVPEEEEVVVIPEEEEEEAEEEEDSEVEEISDEFLELTSEQDQMVSRALVPNPPDQVLVDDFRLQLTRRDFATLAGLSWLNDEIINFYFNLIMRRSESQGYPKSYVFSTFFYPKVNKEGHKAVRRWTKAVDLFTFDYVLIPVHLGNHWCLAVVDFRRRELRYYDSMGMANKECLQIIRNYLSEEHKIKKNSDFDWGGWQLFSAKDIPQQMNGSDCGMFACKFAEYVSRDAPITFNQRHMPYFRRRMVFEILTKKLM